jgi:glycosyltransferase involved in cell wall biosynthesis
MFLSFVITCFNRAHCVSQAIESVLENIKEVEIILVDDSSTDDSVALVTKKFQSEIEAGVIRVLPLENNLGVTGAKNAGYRASSGSWVVFLDSDDYLLENVGNLILSELVNYRCLPVVFFRCADSDGNLVGTRLQYPRYLGLSEYLIAGSYGEALTAVNKVILADSFSYPQELRGYEGLGCLAVIRDFGPALLSTVVARRYVQDGVDRLSARSVFLKRSGTILEGHLRVYRDYKDFFSIHQRVLFLFKIGVYWLVSRIVK